MDYRILGRTGVKVSRMCFGTMSFGSTADEAESARMFHRCRDRGINLFDCANVYAGGRSEEILGELMADCRDELVITTKVFGATGHKGVNDQGEGEPLFFPGECPVGFREQVSEQVIVTQLLEGLYRTTAEKHLQDFFINSCR